MDEQLLSEIRDLLSRLDRADERVLQRLIDAYEKLMRRMSGNLDALEQLIERLYQADELTDASIRNSPAFQRLLDDALAEIEDYMAYTAVELRNSVQDDSDVSLFVGLSMLALFLTYYGRPTSGDELTQPDALDFLSELLAPDGLLMSKISESAPYYVEQIRGYILDSVRLGKNPRVIADGLANLFGLPLTDALRWMRTAQLYSYRKATQELYRANGISYWVWMATLDDRVCLSCIALHGTLHPVSEFLNDHHNGRCAMLPYLGENPIEVSGEEWFSRLSDEQQKQLMGGAMYRAWKAGAISFSDLSTIYNDDVFGAMRVENSLVGILGKGAKEYYER